VVVVTRSLGFLQFRRFCRQAGPDDLALKDSLGNRSPAQQQSVQHLSLALVQFLPRGAHPRLGKELGPHLGEQVSFTQFFASLFHFQAGGARHFPQCCGVVGIEQGVNLLCHLYTLRNLYYRTLFQRHQN